MIGKGQSEHHPADSEDMRIVRTSKYKKVMKKAPEKVLFSCVSPYLFEEQKIDKDEVY